MLIHVCVRGCDSSRVYFSARKCQLYLPFALTTTSETHQKCACFFWLPSSSLVVFVIGGGGGAKILLEEGANRCAALNKTNPPRRKGVRGGECAHTHGRTKRKSIKCFCCVPHMYKNKEWSGPFEYKSSLARWLDFSVSYRFGGSLIRGVYTQCVYFGLWAFNVVAVRAATPNTIIVFMRIHFQSGAIIVLLLLW